MVESDLVESFFEVKAVELIVHVRFFWQEMQVHLKSFANQMVIKIGENRSLGILTTKHSEHAVGDADNREMLVILQVVRASPFKDATYLSQVLLIFNAILGVSWDINTIDTGKLFLKSFLVQGEVNGDNTGSCRLQEINMGTLKETGIGKLEVVSPLIRDGLCEHTEDWLIVLGAHVVTCIE